MKTDGNHLATDMTKRELFAAMAMQGVCANVNTMGATVEQVAELAVRQADALIAALNAAEGE